jgi:hypothetical protein
MSSSTRKAIQRQPEITLPAVSPVSTPPLLVDIRTAAAILGISIFAVRNACWNRDTKRALKPVRQGLKFLFSPVALNDFAAKLVAGEIQFPATPVKAKPRKRAA